MRLSAAAVAAAAGLLQVGAAPIRILITGPIGEGGPILTPEVASSPIEGLRFGHAVPTADWSTSSPPPATAIAFAPGPFRGSVSHRMRHGCGGRGRMNRFKQKAVEISNAFRGALGLPLIEHYHPHPYLSIHPVPPGHGRPHTVHVENGFVTVSEIEGLHAVPAEAASRPGEHHPHRVQILDPQFVSLVNHSHHHHRFRAHGHSFMGRLHFSLMNLGPWEGRAVAFVLGCGIGVLLRMFWVLFVVTFRSIRGSRSSEQPTYTQVTIIEEYDDASDDETVISAAPPTYKYPVDEKVAVEEAK